MSFLDNLESNLKNLENATENEVLSAHQKRLNDRVRALAVAPHAYELKSKPFVNEFLTHAVRIGHSLKTRVAPVWVEDTLRVDARNKRLELRPTPEGVIAVFIKDGQEIGSEPLDLSSNPEALATRWLSV
jgi:hypothetical protein